MKYCILLLLIFFYFPAGAQTDARDTTVIETVFRKYGIHKDGYDAGGKVIDIPAAVAAKMDKKKVRITGFDEKPVEVSMEAGRVMQGRFEKLPDGRVMTTGVYFQVISIRIWEKNRWKLVYTRE